MVEFKFDQMVLFPAIFHLIMPFLSACALYPSHSLPTKPFIEMASALFLQAHFLSLPTLYAEPESRRTICHFTE